MTHADMVVNELISRIALLEKDRAILLAELKLKDIELEEIRSATNPNQPND